jgi:hypothetical protein
MQYKCEENEKVCMTQKATSATDKLVQKIIYMTF